MKRSVRLTATLWGAALLLIFTFVALAVALATGVAPVFAAAAIAAGATATSTPITPVGTPTPAAVPTISAGTAGSIAPAAPTLTGATIATSLTCVTTIIGLLIAVITLGILLRGGYGPFLRALVFGGKKGKGGDLNADQDDGHWDASHTLNYRPGPDGFDDRFAGYNDYDEPANARRGSRGRGDRSGESPRGRGGARRRAPAGNSRRNDWA
ncbi:MAG TPA: hypothetical protein VIC27_04905 [Ktedonobacterales bacterium]